MPYTQFNNTTNFAAQTHNYDNKIELTAFLSSLVRNENEGKAGHQITNRFASPWAKSLNLCSSQSIRKRMADETAIKHIRK